MTDEAKLNQVFFHALQVAAARSIPDACTRFGVDAKFAAQIADLSIEDMELLCLDGMVLFKPVMPCAQLLRIMRVADPCARNIMARLSIPVDATTKTTAAEPPILAKKRRSG